MAKGRSKAMMKPAKKKPVIRKGIKKSKSGKKK